MKRSFDQLRAALDEFAQQDEFPMLVVGARSDELAYVLKFLQALEETLPSHLIAAFHQPFHAARPWLDAVIESVRLQLEVLGPERAARGQPLPVLPLELLDPRTAPEQRLLALLRWLPSLLPNDQDYRIVVGLLPLDCSDREGFARLVAHVVPHPEPQPWMAALRLIVWDDREQPQLRPALRDWPAAHVLDYEVDFSTPTLTDALARDVADRSRPIPERMLGLVQLAALDFSYGRHASALEKYAALHDYYQRTKVPAMQALCLQGAGDTLHAAGDSTQAKLRLQQAIALGMQSNNLGVLLTSLASIAGVCMALGHYADAESYADSGTKVAAALLNPFAYCEFYERRGDAQLAGARPAEAITSYTRARELCRTYEHFHCWKAVLRKQVAIYEEAMMRRERDALADELALVEGLEQQRAEVSA